MSQTTLSLFVLMATGVLPQQQKADQYTEKSKLRVNGEIRQLGPSLKSQ